MAPTKRKASKRKASKRKSTKRKSSKRKASKRKASKRKASKRKASKRKASKRKSTRRKATKRKSTRSSPKRVNVYLNRKKQCDYDFECPNNSYCDPWDNTCTRSSTVIDRRPLYANRYETPLYENPWNDTPAYNNPPKRSTYNPALYQSDKNEGKSPTNAFEQYKKQHISGYVAPTAPSSNAYKSSSGDYGDTCTTDSQCDTSVGQYCDQNAKRCNYR
jgi:hypothetical protein